MIKVWQRWRRLNALMATRHRTWTGIQWHSLVTCVKSWWYSVPIIGTTSRNFSIIEYTIDATIYWIPIATRLHGPPALRRIVRVIDMDTAQDVTAYVRPYLGPAEDTHRIALTPRMIGLSDLTITDVDGETFSVDRDAPIVPIVG